MSDQAHPSEGYSMSSKSWEAKGMAWRTEPEIGAERQQYLAARRTIQPDIARGIYPFKDIEPKLTRADIEWLLATHESGGMRGPVDWSDKEQQSREGLDLRAANLVGTDLSRLPLARLQAGLRQDAWDVATTEQRDMAAAHLEGAHLDGAYLEGGAFRRAHLEGSFLREAHLEHADLFRAHLEQASLYRARASGASFVAAHLEGANLGQAYLPGADLRRAFLDAVTNLLDVTISDKRYGSVLLADVRWGEANIAVVRWSQMIMLGDERVAQGARTPSGQRKDRATRFEEYTRALRATRQLALLLEAQGLGEDAARFRYRSETLQRTLLRLQGRWGAAFFSWFLDIIAGYGYRPGRLIIFYCLVLTVYGAAYYTMSMISSASVRPLSPAEAIALSLQIVVGRSVPDISEPLNPMNFVADSEILFSLAIGFIFANAFTKRFFGR